MIIAGDLPLVVQEGQNVAIRCNLQREQSPFWIINGSVFGLLTISSELPYISIVNSYLQLDIPFITRDINSTNLQCASFDDKGIIHGNSVDLIVSSKSAGYRVEGCGS